MKTLLALLLMGCLMWTTTVSAKGQHPPRNPYMMQEVTQVCQYTGERVTVPERLHYYDKGLGYYQTSLM